MCKFVIFFINITELAGIPYRSCTVEINAKEYGSGVGAGQKGAKQAAGTQYKHG